MLMSHNKPQLRNTIAELFYFNKLVKLVEKEDCFIFKKLLDIIHSISQITTYIIPQKNTSLGDIFYVNKYALNKSPRNT